MTDLSPLWPARLHHLKITSDQPPVLIDFYQRVLEQEVRELSDGEWVLAGGERSFVIGRGPRNGLGYSAFAIDDAKRVAELQDFVTAEGINVQPSPTPLFGPEAFAVNDPDGNILVFGTPLEDAPAKSDRLPARLQHSVVGSPNIQALTDYRRTLGFALSDEVKDDDGNLTAVFLRSDDEHHSQAIFSTKDPKFDHFSMEATSWNDIRDWADHLGSMRIPLSWGPGRHGPGNNLFFMVCDADGNMVEVSAEIEHMDRDMASRTWKHEPYTLNLWGVAWMRS
jgi:catechol 2,3-dioxygenase-like lactoylglutathione lyase family enzyme